MKQKRNYELISLSSMADMPYNYHAGYYYSKFLRELRDNKRIYGVKCHKCGRIYVPPRIVCRDCFVKIEEFVPVSNQGTIIAFTVTAVPYTDPNTGEPKKIPFAAAYIKLDGTDSNILHRLDEIDQSRIKAGMRVHAVFSDKRTGDYFHDIDHFKIIR